MSFNFLSNDKKMTPIQKYFDNMWFIQKEAVIEAAFAGTLQEYYPECPFSASEIMQYAKDDDWNLWSKYAEVFGKANKKIDDVATSVSNSASDFVDSVSSGLTLAKYLTVAAVVAYFYNSFKKK